MIEIDQSSKIEETNKATIIAFSNSKNKSIKISAIEKQKLIKAMRALDYPKKNFRYKIFAGLVFLLLRNAGIKEIIIDKEYFGNEALIKNILIQLFDKEKIKTPEIYFDLIGKKSRAHKIAIDTFRGKRKEDMIVTLKDIMKLFYKSQ